MRGRTINHESIFKSKATNGQSPAPTTPTVGGWDPTTVSEDWYNYDYNWTSINKDIELGASVGNGGTNAASKSHKFDWTSNPHDIYGSRPRYETYEVQVQTIDSETVTVWATKWETEEQTVYVTDRVDDTGTEFFTGKFSHISAKAGGNLAIDAGQDVTVNGLVTTTGSGSDISLHAERNLTVEGLIPTNAIAANTLAADAKVTAPSTISLTAGSNLTVATSGVLEVTGSDVADSRTISLDAGGRPHLCRADWPGPHFRQYPQRRHYGR